MKKVKLSVYKNDQLVLAKDFDFSDNVEQQILVGRAPECHLMIEDYQVSRNQFVLTYNAGILSLKNLSQYESLYVNGSFVNNALIADNDNIKFFDYILKIEGIELEQTKNNIQIHASDGVRDLEVEDQEDVTELLDDKLNLEENIKDEIEKSRVMDLDNLVTEDEEDSSFVDEQEDFSLDDEQDSSAELETYEEKTKVIEGFVHFTLFLKGDYAPYDKYSIDTPKVLIGSDKDKVDLCFNDPSVSKEHALITLEKSVVKIEDLKSQFGVYVNGQKVNKASLSAGDEILIGDTSLILSVESSVLKEEAGRLMPTPSMETVLEEQIISSEDLEGDLNIEIKNIKGLKGKFQYYLADPKRKRIFYILVIGLLVLVLLDDDDATNSQIKKISKKSAESQAPKTKNKAQEVVRSEQEIEYLESHYQLAKTKLEEGNYEQSMYELDLVMSVAPEYKQSAYLLSLAKEGLVRIEENERKKQEEKRRIEVLAKIKDLIEKIESSLADGNISVAESFLNQAFEIDPENTDLVPLKIEIENLVKSNQKKIEEERLRLAKRQEILEKLVPIKTYFSENNWYQSMVLAKKLFTEKNIEKDLLDEVQKIYEQSQVNLKQETDELLTRARTFRQGEDNKNAFDLYQQVLKIHPNNAEAISEMEEISKKLSARARIVFREGLVSESISLFDDAKEKFLEVLQIAPKESDYYEKAKSRLDEFYFE
jgi:pSer/pThr/pTyr-binding forkhead associated (FHA) protein